MRIAGGSYSPQNNKGYHPFTKNLRFKPFYMRGLKNLNPEEISKMPATTPKEKFQRAVCKASILSKGLCKAEKAGLRLKPLDKSTWLEAVEPKHHYSLISQIIDEAYLESKNSILIKIITFTSLTFPCLKSFAKKMKEKQEGMNKEDWLQSTKAKNKIKKKLKKYDEAFDEELSAQDLESYEVKYCSSQEGKQYELRFSEKEDNNRTFLSQKGSLYRTYDKESHARGWAMFVVSPEKKMYANSSTRFKFHHSSFLSGQPVLFAGEIKIDAEGHLQALSNKSGHYQVGVEQILQVLRFFRESGVSLQDVFFKDVSGSEKYYKAEELLNLLEQDNKLANKQLSNYTNRLESFWRIPPKITPTRYYEDDDYDPEYDWDLHRRGSS